MRARRPWRSAFIEEAALPSAVFGPVHFFALRRFAAICLFVAMMLPELSSRNQFARERCPPASTKFADVTWSGVAGAISISGRVYFSAFRLALGWVGGRLYVAGFGCPGLKNQGFSGMKVFFADVSLEKAALVSVGDTLRHGATGPANSISAC